MRELLGVFAVMAWLAGIVIAKGFWSTVIAIVVFPYGWYLAVEKVMIYLGAN